MYATIAPRPIDRSLLGPIPKKKFKKSRSQYGTHRFDVPWPEMA